MQPLTPQEQQEYARRFREEFPSPMLLPSIASLYRDDQKAWSAFLFNMSSATGISSDGYNITPKNFFEFYSSNLFTQNKRIDKNIYDKLSSDSRNVLDTLDEYTRKTARASIDEEASEALWLQVLGEARYNELNAQAVDNRYDNPTPDIVEGIFSSFKEDVGGWLTKSMAEAINKATGRRVHKDLKVRNVWIEHIFDDIAYNLLVDDKKADITKIPDTNENQPIIYQLEKINKWIDEMKEKFSRDEILAIAASRDVINPNKLSPERMKEIKRAQDNYEYEQRIRNGEKVGDVSPEVLARIEIASASVQELEQLKREDALIYWAGLNELADNRIFKKVEGITKKRPSVSFEAPINTYMFGFDNQISSIATLSSMRTPSKAANMVKEYLSFSLPEEVLDNLSDSQLYFAANKYVEAMTTGSPLVKDRLFTQANKVILGAIDTEDRGYFREVYQGLIEAFNNEFNTEGTKLFGKFDLDRSLSNISAMILAGVITQGFGSAIAPVIGMVTSKPLLATSIKLAFEGLLYSEMELHWSGKHEYLTTGERISRDLSYAAAGAAMGAAFSKLPLPAAETALGYALKGGTRGSLVGSSIGLYSSAEDPLLDKMKSLAAWGGGGFAVGATLGLAASGVSWLMKATVPTLLRKTPARYRETINATHASTILEMSPETATKEEYISKLIPKLEEANVPQDIIEFVEEGLKNLELKDIFSTASTLIEQTPLGTHRLIYTNGSFIMPVGEYGTLDEAVKASAKLISAVEANSTLYEKIMDIGGRELYDKFLNTTRGLRDVVNRMKYLIKSGEDYRLNKEAVEFIVNEARKAGVDENIIRGLEDLIAKSGITDILPANKIFKFNSDIANRYAKELESFIGVLDNHLAGQFTKQSIERAVKTIDGAAKFVGDKTTLTFESSRVSDSVREAIIKLKNALESPLGNGNGVGFDLTTEIAGNIDDFVKALENIQIDLKGVEIIDSATLEMFDTVLSNLIDGFKEMSLNNSFEHNTSYLFERAASVLKSLSYEQNNIQHLVGKVGVLEFARVSEAAATGIFELRGDSFFDNIVMRFLRNPLTRIGRAFGYDSAIFRTALSSQIKGQQQLGRTIQYLQNVTGKYAKMHGVDPNKLWSGLDKTIRIPSSFTYVNGGVVAGKETVEITLSNAMEMLLTVGDEGGLRAMGMASEYKAVLPNGKIVDISTGLIPKEEVIKRAELNSFVKRVKSFKKSLSKAEDVSRKFVELEHTLPSEVKEKLQPMIKNAMDYIGKKGGEKKLNRIINQILVDAEELLFQHAHKYGFTAEIAEAHLKVFSDKQKHLRKVLNKAVVNPKVSQSEIDYLRKALEEAEQHLATNPIKNGAIGLFIKSELQKHITPEMRALTDIYYDVMRFNAEALNVSTSDVFGFSLAGNAQYFPIRRDVLNLDPGSQKSIIHSSFLKPRTMSRQPIVFSDFNKTFFNQVSDVSVAAGSFKEIWLLERYYNSNAFKNFVQGKLVGNTKHYRKLLEDIAKDINIFGRTTRTEDIAKIIREPISLTQGMYMSNLSIGVAANQLSSISVAGNVGISPHFLHDPSNIKHLNRSVAILLDDGFFAARFYMGGINPRAASTAMQDLSTQTLGATATIRSADRYAIANIFTAASKQTAARLGLPLRDKKVVKIAMEMTKEATLLSQPTWLGATSTGLSRYPLTSLLFSPFRTARDAAFNSMLYAIDRGLWRQGVANYVASQVWYAANKTAFKFIGAAATGLILQKRDVFPSNFNEYAKIFGGELGRALSGITPFSQALYETGEGLVNIMLSRPYTSTSFFKDNMFERSVIEPMDKTIRQMREAWKYFKIKKNINNTVFYNADKDITEIRDENGNVVFETKDPSYYLMSNIFRHKGEDVYQAMTDADKYSYARLLLTVAQYTMLFGFQRHDMAYALGQFSKSIPINEKNKIYNQDVYKYAKGLGIGRRDIERIMINTNPDWLERDKKIKDTLPVNGLGIIKYANQTKLTDGNIAAMINSSISPIITNINYSLNTVEREMKRMRLEQAISGVFDREQFSSLQKTAVDLMIKKDQLSKEAEMLLKKKGKGNIYDITIGKWGFEIKEKK